MEWVEAYGQDREPTFAQIDAFVGNPLWEELNTYFQTAYGVKPQLAYSGCSGQPGWNVKYKKAGKSLCTMYPMDGYYTVLVVVGKAESHEAELLIPTFSEHVQDVFVHAGTLMGARWLMLNVTGSAVMEDVKRLVALRRTPANA